MKEGWVNQKVFDFCYVTDFVANGSFASLRQNVRYINFPDYAILVRLTDFTKKWVKDFVYVSKESFEFLKKSSLVKGDLIMSNVGEPGIVFLVPELNKPMTLGPNSILIRPNTEYTSSKFLYLYFLSINGKEQIDEISTGAAQKKFNKTSFRSLEIPLPPLPEQQRIVSILDEAFAAIDKAKANAEKNLKNAKELFESYLQGVFENKGDGWEEKTIQELTQVINGYAFASKDFNSTNTIKSIKITNVGVKEFVEEGNNYLPEKFKDTLKEVQVKEGNIVIALTRTIISSGLKVAIVPSSYDGALVNQRVAGLVPNEKIIDQRYLYYFLTTNGVAKYVLAHVNALMQPNLSIYDLKNLPVPCPTINEQLTIVLKLDALSTETKRLESIYQQKLTDLEELKKSILQKAFNGELNTADICV